MRNTFLLGFVIVTKILTSCGDDNTADIIITGNCTANNAINSDHSGENETILLSGNYTEDLILDEKNKYILDGPVIMETGTTIKIPAGMTIKANKGSEIYLAITQGAQIIAEGTSSSPIVFTSNAATPNAGDWGGLILLGKAPVNSVDGTKTTSATSEIANLPYGGIIENDDSGTLSYVRVEYSGGKVDGQSENNGISFYGIGNGTLVSYIQIFKSLDDGFEFFGGTVNADFISIINSDDDSVDWTEGYSGTLTNIHIRQSIRGDKAFECDGYNTDIGNNSNPAFFSAPKISNVTIEGLGSLHGKEAIRLRAGTQGVFDNIIIIGYAEGFDLDGDADITGTALENNNNPTGRGVLNQELMATNIKFKDVTTEVKNDTGFSFKDTDFVTINTTATGTDFDFWGIGWARNK